MKFAQTGGNKGGAVEEKTEDKRMDLRLAHTSKRCAHTAKKNKNNEELLTSNQRKYISQLTAVRWSTSGFSWSSVVMKVCAGQEKCAFVVVIYSGHGRSG